MRYRANKLDCQACSLKPQCCPTAPARKIPRSIHDEDGRDVNGIMCRPYPLCCIYSRMSRCSRGAN